MSPTRRHLLAAPLLLPARVLGRAGSTAPSDRVRVGILGAGLRALFETRQYPWFDNVDIVAVCDAQQSRRDSAKATLEQLYSARRGHYSGIRSYLDFHELLAQPDIDAVYIASSDHWHVSMLIPALRAGKHVHCEKPLGVSVEQDLAARNAARQAKRVFQYGAELRSDRATTHALECVLNGRIGEVKKIYVLAPPSASGGATGPVLPIPPGFDFDRWLGPAPARPFTAALCLTEDPRSIFNVYDYSLGNIANWGAHPLDQLQRWADAAGRSEPPLRYEGSGRFASGGLFDCATQWRVRCTWRDGLVLDFMDELTYTADPNVPHPTTVRDWGNQTFRNIPNGVIFMGAEGWICVSYTGVAASDDKILKTTLGPNAKRLHNSALATLPAGLPTGYQQALTAAHHQDWIKAIRTNGETVAGIETAWRSDLISQLSDLAIRTAAPVEWDPVHETIPNNETARAMLRRPMRSPWAVTV